MSHLLPYELFNLMILFAACLTENRSQLYAKMQKEGIPILTIFYSNVIHMNHDYARGLYQKTINRNSHNLSKVTQSRVKCSGFMGI